MGVKRKQNSKSGFASKRTSKKQKLSEWRDSKHSQRIGRIVKLEDLNWTKIEAPDQLGDYEGFYGLEEIDGVAIDRDESTQTVSYRINDDSKLLGKSSNSAEVDNDNATRDDDSSVWEGFDDEEEEDVKGMTDKPSTSTTRAKSTHRHSSSDENSFGKSSRFDVLLDDADDDTVDIPEWSRLNLSPSVLNALAKLKFKAPTEIQSSAIPHILHGHDLIGKAPTGSGKTLAFGIPILDSWISSADTSNSADENPNPIALILLPTRELAHQIEKHLSALSAGIEEERLTIATITGGLSVQKQRRQLTNARIIIATPGRLWDVMNEAGSVVSALRKIKFLVIDEADRMLSEGHFKEMEEILNALNRDELVEDGKSGRESTSESPSSNRQTLVFSATFDKSLQRKLGGHGRSSSSNPASMEYLLQKLQFRSEQPKFIDINPVEQMAPHLREGLLECPGNEKDLYLYAVLLMNPPRTRTLVFVNSIAAVRRLVPLLQNLNLNALALHSSMPQKARLRSLERFQADAKPADSTKPQAKNAKSPASYSPVLVATDVAARGLDIPNINLVVHYHVPRTADMYIHRSGRTARAHASGSSVLLSSPEEAAGVRRLVAKIHVSHKNAKRTADSMQSLHIDGTIVSRLKRRVLLAKQLADATLAKEKKNSEDQFLRNAAEDLGVDYDSDEFAAQAANMGGRKGRGAGRQKRENEARSMSKAELGAKRAELKDLLSKRVNAGVSERYLTSGGVDVNALLAEQEAGQFLGLVNGLGFV